MAWEGRGMDVFLHMKDDAVSYTTHKNAVSALPWPDLAWPIGHQKIEWIEAGDGERGPSLTAMQSRGHTCTHPAHPRVRLRQGLTFPLALFFAAAGFRGN